MSNHTYASTHPHPTHIDIPPAPPSRAMADEPDTLDGGILGEDGDGGAGGGGGGGGGMEVEAKEEPATPSAARPPPAKGILKNPLRRPSQYGDGEGGPTEAERVQWDEKNLQETEIGKDSLMKISEPKTPYVWGDPEKDLMLTDVPDFDLQSPNPNPTSPRDRRPSMNSTRSSSSSSRSASFSLPSKSAPVRPGSGSSRSRTPSESGPSAQSQGQGQGHLIAPNPSADGSSGDVSAKAPGEGMEISGLALGATSANTAANAQRPRTRRIDGAGGVDGDGMDGDGEVFSDDSDEEMDEEAKAKHAEFQGKRKEHYAMEAKLALERARELMRQDEAGDGDGDAEEGGMEVDEQVHGNGNGA